MQKCILEVTVKGLLMAGSTGEESGMNRDLFKQLNGQGPTCEERNRCGEGKKPRAGV